MFDYNDLQIGWYGKEHAIVFGLQRANLAASGTPIGVLDLMIASQGVASNLTVVTHNTREFDRVKGLRLEDWA